MKRKQYHAYFTDKTVGEIQNVPNFLTVVEEIDPFDQNVYASPVRDTAGYICESSEIFENTALINFVFCYVLSQKISSL